MDNKIRVLLVDDQPLFRERLSGWLKNYFTTYCNLKNLLYAIRNCGFMK